MEEQKANLGVVVLGACTGEPHLFHAECIQSHYDSMAEGKGHYKCMVCQKAYGVRTGAMPHGTMTWRQDLNTRLSGQVYAPFAIIINYHFPSG